MRIDRVRKFCVIHRLSANDGVAAPVVVVHLLNQLGSIEHSPPLAVAVGGQRFITGGCG